MQKNKIGDIGKKNIKRIDKEISDFRESVKSSFGEQDFEKISEALDMMLYLHCEQEDRMDSRPYIIHPLEAASDLVNKLEIEDEDLVIAALLHDSVEDQSRRIIEKFSDENAGELSAEELQSKAFDVIGKKYGIKVKDIVKGMTNPNFAKVLSIEHIKEAIKKPDVFVVKLSDFMRNAGNIPQHEPTRINFIKRYIPAIRDVFIPALEAMDESHLLYKKRDALLSELNDLYENINK